MVLKKDINDDDKDDDDKNKNMNQILNCLAP